MVGRLYGEGPKGNGKDKESKRIADESEEGGEGPWWREVVKGEARMNPLRSRPGLTTRVTVSSAAILYAIIGAGLRG